MFTDNSGSLKGHAPDIRCEGWIQEHSGGFIEEACGCRPAREGKEDAGLYGSGERSRRHIEASVGFKS